MIIGYRLFVNFDKGCWKIILHVHPYKGYNLQMFKNKLLSEQVREYKAETTKTVITNRSLMLLVNDFSLVVGQ